MAIAHPGLIDTHAHLDQIVDVENALQRARAAGVTSIIAVGMNMVSGWQTLKLARKNRGFVYASLGIHPWAVEAAELDDTCTFISSQIRECVAIGEIGLDFLIKKDVTLQQRVCECMLGIAVRHQKPVITHSRGSYEEVFQLVKAHDIKKAVFHWYTGPFEIVERIIESGYFISATPAVAYSQKHREVIERVPLENLLLETDCPVEYKKEVSEPAWVRMTLDEVAKLKKLDPLAVARATTENATRLFGLD